MIDEFPVLSLIVTAIGASGSSHVHGLWSCCTQADTVNIVVRTRQLLPVNAAIAGTHHATHLNPSVQIVRIVRCHAQVTHVRMPGLGMEKPLLRLWYGPKANTFLPALPVIVGTKDGCRFATNVHGLGVLGMHQDAVRIIRWIGCQMSPGQATVIRAIHPCLVRR